MDRGGPFSIGGQSHTAAHSSANPPRPARHTATFTLSLSVHSLALSLSHTHTLFFLLVPSSSAEISPNHQIAAALDGDRAASQWDADRLQRNTSSSALLAQGQAHAHAQAGAREDGSSSSSSTSHAAANIAAAAASASSSSSPGAHRGTLVHRLAKLDEAPTKGYLGSIDPSSPNYVPAQSSNHSISMANSTRVPHPHQLLTKSHALRSLSEDNLDGQPEIGEWIEPAEDDEALPTVLRQRTTSHQWTEENARAGAIFPVRPNAELMRAAAAAEAAVAGSPASSSSSTAASGPNAPSALALTRAASELPPLVSLLAPNTSPEEDKLPPRILSSYLLKQGKARKKWSRRYFTLLPRQFLLIYSKRSKEDQRRDRDPEQQALRERELKDRERALEKQKERREKLAKERAKTKERAREAAAAERKKRRDAAIKAGSPPPPDSEPEDDEKPDPSSSDEEEDPATAAQGVVFGDDSTVPSKDGGDSDADEEQAAGDEDGEGGGDDVVQISLRKFRLDPDGNLGLTIIVPLHSGAGESNVVDDAGQPLSPSSSGSTSSLSLLGGTQPADEKRIELRAESKKIAALWLVELRRLQYQIYCVSQYANILSRNKVYTMQGRFELIQDPTPFLPVHMAASIAAGNALRQGDDLVRPKPSALSLFTSALTGDDRRCCLKCKSAFGLLRKTIVCIDCKGCFCNRSSCVMPLLHNTEEDTFSVASLAADHSLNANANAAGTAASEIARRQRKRSKKRGGLDASSSQRICNDCELIRSHDPLYQRLLHGQLNLCLKVVSGQGLMQCDLVGASDPYIRFSLAGREHRSRAVQDSLNPVWDDSAEFNLQWHDPSTIGGEKDVQAIFDIGQDASAASARAAQAGSAAVSAALSKSLCVEVWDENAGLIEDTFMGCVYIPVGDLEKNILYEDRFPLRSKRDAAALVVAEERNVLAAGLSAGVDALKGAGGALGGALLGVVGGGSSNKKRITGSIHLQIMLATSGYTADMLRILPSLEGLGRRPSDLTLAMKAGHQQQQQKDSTLPSSPPPPHKKESSSSMASRSTPPSIAHASISAAASGSPDAHSPESAAIRKELHHFLRSSRLHPLLRRMLDLFLAFNFGYWLDLWREILTYQNPFVSLLAFVGYCCVVWRFPVDLVPAMVPLALLLHLGANLMTRKVAEGDAILARFAAEDAAEIARKAAQTKAEEDAASPLHKFGAGAKAQGIRNFFSKRFGSTTSGAAAVSPKPAPSPTSATSASASPPVPAPTPAASASVPPRVRILTAGSSSPSTSRNSAPSSSRPLGQGGRTMSAASASGYPLSPMQAEFFDEAGEESGVAVSGMLMPPQTPTPAVGGAAAVTPLLTPRSTASSGPALALPPPLVVGDSPRVAPIAVPAPAAEPAAAAAATVSSAESTPISSDAAALASPTAGGADEEHSGSILLRMRRLKRQVRLVQSMIDATADLIEEFLRIWQWRDIDKSQRFVRGCLLVFFLFWYFSPRWLLLAAGVYKWSQHLFKLRRRIKTIRKQMKNSLKAGSGGGATGAGGAGLRGKMMMAHAASQQGVVSFRRPSQLMMQAESKNKGAQAR